MSEVFFYPVITIAAWTIAQALAEPSRDRIARMTLALALAKLTRLQALVLLPVVLSAVGFDALLARSVGRLHRTGPVALAAFLPALCWLAYQASRGEPTLGAYDGTAAETYHAADAARYVVYHAGSLVLSTAVLPVCALLALVANGVVRGERDARRRATVAVTFALCVGVVAQVGVFASQHVGQIAGRDQLCLVPSLCVCFVLWLSDADATGVRVRAVGAALALALLSALPLKTFVTYYALFDSITIAPLWHLRDLTSPGVVTAVVLGSAVVLCASFVFLPRRLRSALPVVLLVLGIGGSFVSTHEVIDQAHRARDVLVGHNPRWLDDAAHGRTATYVYDGGRDWPAVWQALFWNRSIAHVAVLGDVDLPGPAPQRHARLRGDGRIDIPDPDAILPTSYTAAVTPVAEIAQLIPGQEGLRRWQLEQPPRLLTRTLGLQAAGDIYAHEPATLIAYDCTNGTWQLTFLVKEPQDVVVRQNGKPFLKRHYPPGTPADFFENIDVPATARPGTDTCRLDVLSTGLLGTTRFGFIHNQ
jgi:hypothetical protein